MVFLYLYIIPVTICLKIRSSDSVSRSHWQWKAQTKQQTWSKETDIRNIHLFIVFVMWPQWSSGEQNTGPTHQFPLSFQPWILRSPLKRWKTDMCKHVFKWQMQVLGTCDTHPASTSRFQSPNTAMSLSELHFASGLHTSWMPLLMQCCQGEKKCCVSIIQICQIFCNLGGTGLFF